MRLDVLYQQSVFLVEFGKGVQQPFLSAQFEIYTFRIQIIFSGIYGRRIVIVVLVAAVKISIILRLEIRYGDQVVFYAFF